MKIAIGGIGGSGTRAVATLFMQNNYHFGYDLNTPNDNLLYTLFFKHKSSLLLTQDEFFYRIQLFYKILSSSEPITKSEYKYIHSLVKIPNILHSLNWLLERSNKIDTYERKRLINWGWKEPNTHIHIDKFLNFDQDLKFIYVYRNGLDMAYSSNQNQLKLWGNIFLNSNNISITPQQSLSFWCKVHKRMINIQNVYPERVYFLNLEEFCLNTEKMIDELKKFLNVPYMKYENIFKLSNSTGRYLSKDLSVFHQKDLDYIQDIYKNILL